MSDQQKLVIDKDLEELRELKLVTNLLKSNRLRFNSSPIDFGLYQNLENDLKNLELTDQSNVQHVELPIRTFSSENDNQAVIEKSILDYDATMNDSSDLQKDYSSYEDALDSFTNFSFSSDSAFDWNCIFDSSFEFNYINMPVTPPNTPNELFNNIMIKLNLNLNITRQ